MKDEELQEVLNSVMIPKTKGETSIQPVNHSPSTKWPTMYSGNSYFYDTDMLRTLAVDVDNGTKDSDVYMFSWWHTDNRYSISKIEYLDNSTSDFDSEQKFFILGSFHESEEQQFQNSCVNDKIMISWSTEQLLKKVMLSMCKIYDELYIDYHNGAAK